MSDRCGYRGCRRIASGKRIVPFDGDNVRIFMCAEHWRSDGDIEEDCAYSGITCMGSLRRISSRGSTMLTCRLHRLWGYIKLGINL